LACAGLRPNQFGIFVLGFSNTTWAGLPLPLDLGVVGMPSCTQYCSVDLTTAVFNTTGAMQMVVSMPTAVTALGFRFYAQVLGQDPGVNAFGAVTSNGIALTVGN
jgi:hypothetical protein